jgi:hypothetical protein
MGSLFYLVELLLTAELLFLIFPFPELPLPTSGLMLSPFSICAGVSAIPCPIPTSPIPSHIGCRDAVQKPLCSGAWPKTIPSSQYTRPWNFPLHCYDRPAETG